MRRALVVVIALVGLAACSSSQDPEIPGPERAGTTVVPNGGNAPATYNYPPRCPEGGPDATTPKVGCLAEDGTLLRP